MQGKSLDTCPSSRKPNSYCVNSRSTSALTVGFPANTAYSSSWRRCTWQTSWTHVRWFQLLFICSTQATDMTTVWSLLNWEKCFDFEEHEWKNIQQSFGKLLLELFSPIVPLVQFHIATFSPLIQVSVSVPHWKFYLPWFVLPVRPPAVLTVSEPRINPNGSCWQLTHYSGMSSCSEIPSET